MTSGEEKVLKEKAQALDREQWRAILTQAPIEQLFYALMREIMRLRDIKSAHDQAEERINRAYAQDDDWREWT